MKKKSASASSDELRKEYDFEAGTSRPNRFAERILPGSVAVLLDPDVAEVFASSDAVNGFLRSAIIAMPKRPKKKPLVSALRKRGV